MNGEQTARPIRIIGINETGYQSGNATMTNGRVLPWLQATSSTNPWQLWGVEFRDVVILDAQNRRVTTYNLTSNNLMDSQKYSDLKNLLINAAHE